MKYKGLLFKFNPKFDSNLMYVFYSRLKDAQSKSYVDYVMYRHPQYSFATVKDSLMNKVYRVIDLHDADRVDNKVLVLQDTIWQDVIYFKYDVEHDLSFPFLVSGYKITQEENKEGITRGVDEMTDEIEISTGLLNIARIVKLINKGVAKTFLRLTITDDSSLGVGEKGVIVLFTDKTKWNRPAQPIEVSSVTKGWRYSAFIPLTALDIALFSTKKVSRSRLFIYDDYLTDDEAEKLTMSMKEISKMK